KGDAPVLASADGLVDTAYVHVKQDPPPATAIEIRPRSATISAIGGSVTLTADVRDHMGQPVPATAVSWESLNTPVATVSSGGVVFGLAAGHATVVARYGALSDTAEVVVSPQGAVVQIEVVPQLASVGLGATTPL